MCVGIPLKNYHLLLVGCEFFWYLQKLCRVLFTYPIAYAKWKKNGFKAHFPWNWLEFYIIWKGFQSSTVRVLYPLILLTGIKNPRIPGINPKFDSFTRDLLRSLTIWVHHKSSSDLRNSERSWFWNQSSCNLRNLLWVCINYLFCIHLNYHIDSNWARVISLNIYPDYHWLNLKLIRRPKWLFRGGLDKSVFLAWRGP